MRFLEFYIMAIVLGLASSLVMPLEAASSPSSEEHLEMLVLEFEEECPLPENCLQQKGKSTYRILNILNECMLLSDYAADNNPNVSAVRTKYLQYLFAQSRIAIEETDTNRILGLQRIFNHPYRWRAIQLIQNQDLFIWCVNELVASGQLTNRDISDYLDNYRNYHPRTTRNEGFQILQTELVARGFEIEVNGVYGEQTTKALQSFQSSKSLDVTQFPDSTTLANLGIDPDRFYSLSVSEGFVRYLKE